MHDDGMNRLNFLRYFCLKDEESQCEMDLSAFLVLMEPKGLRNGSESF